MRILVVSLLLSLPVLAAADQTRPIIDVHVHAYGEVAEFGAYGETGPLGMVASKSQAAHIRETFAEFDKHNVVKAVVSGSPASLEAWNAADKQDRVIPALMIDAPHDYGLTVESFDGSAWVGLVPFRVRIDLPGPAKFHHR